MCFLPPQPIIDLTDKILKLESKANLSKEEKIKLNGYIKDRNDISYNYNNSKQSNDNGIFNIVSGFAIGYLLGK
jgi:hypothetical protein